MRQGTTPQFTLEVEDLDLSTAKTVWLIFKQGSNVIKKTNSELTIDGQKIYCDFTQEETLSFKLTRTLKTQLRVLTNYDKAYASNIFNISVDELLVNEVIQ